MTCPRLKIISMSWLSGKGSACQSRRYRRLRFDPWVGKIPRRREWLPSPVFLPGKSHGQRSLVPTVRGGRKELDTTEQEHTGSCQHQKSNPWLMSFLTFTTKRYQFRCHSGDQDPSQNGDYAVHCIPSKQHKARKRNKMTCKSACMPLSEDTIETI